MTTASLAQCAFCDSQRMTQVMDFGAVALAGGFLKASQFAQEQKYPLRLYFCAECYAVQVIDKVDASVLFEDYFYFSSSIETLKRHFVEYAREVTQRFLTPATAAVLEFGCNDGVLLRPLADQGIRTVVGVDPAKNVLATINDPRIETVNAFFDEATASRVVAEYGAMDMVMANNVYAHIPDIQGVTRAVRDVLQPDGVFVFEVHYLGKVVNEMQYDMIYHEHLYYYSLLSAMEHFARHGMVVFDVLPVPIHAGSMRFYVCKEGSRLSRAISPAVQELQQREQALGFDKAATFVDFARRVQQRRTELMELLNELRRNGRTVAGYGASGRANTMIQYCGITSEHLQYMIDDAPAKFGYYTPGSHFEIRDRSVLDGPERPDYVLVFAWSFLDEIRKRAASYLQNGGRLIVPLPTVQVL